MTSVKRKCSTGLFCAAFGVGLLAATICPPQLMLVVVAAALVVVGCWRSMSMQIVIVKSPKLFSGILRKLFGIKKESYID